MKKIHHKIHLTLQKKINAISVLRISNTCQKVESNN